MLNNNNNNNKQHTLSYEVYLKCKQIKSGGGFYTVKSEPSVILCILFATCWVLFGTDRFP